ncbi:MAG: hypothetical protein ACRDTC_10345 [Pseudonocardiaceae bacterium]
MRPLIDLLRETIGPPATLAFGLLMLFLLSRLLSWVWYRVRQRGRVPVMIRATRISGMDANRGDEVLSARLSAYFGEEDPGLHVVLPGSGDVAGPTVAAEDPDSPSGWATLLRLALAVQPAYKLDVTYEMDKNRRASVQLARVPGNRILASKVFDEQEFEGSDEHAVVEAVGCFAIQNLRQQWSIRRRTPRWERWSAQISGYRAYRRALIFEHRDDFPRALREYDTAIRYEPANFIVAVHRAALLELMGEYGEAVKAYRTANELWPEHIETAYRFHANCCNWREKGVERFDEADSVLADITRSLTFFALLKKWSRTLIPSRWNPGERRYWASWFRIFPLEDANKRHHYLMAIEVSTVTKKITRALEDGALSDEERREYFSQALDSLAKLIAKSSKDAAVIRLFHPEKLGNKKVQHSVGHDPRWYHPQIDDEGRVFDAAADGIYRNPKRDGIGWLAHYNAACFFSIALKIPNVESLPPGFTLENWRTDCARAALRELRHATRDPRNMVKAEWYSKDPDLQPLREQLTGSRWQRFAGIVSN